MTARAAGPIGQNLAAILVLLNVACPVEAPADTAPVSNEPAAAVVTGRTARDAISRYQERLTEQQSMYGASDPRLAETLLGLGLAYRAASDHEEAADAFRNALQITRINHGLHSLDQLPYLQRLIEENTTLGRWEDVNNNYYYLYWVYRRNYGDDDPRLLPVIDQVTRAQVQAFNASPELFSGADLRDREALVNKAVQIIETHYGENDPRLIQPLQRIAMHQYYTALQTGRMSDYRHYKSYMRGVSSDDLFTSMVVPVVTNVGGQVTVRYEEIKVPRSGSNAYLPREVAREFKRIDTTERKGRQALERIKAILEREPDASPYARAVAIIHEGDWQLLYDSGRGWRKYERAWALLSQTEQAEQYIDMLFGRPRSLPARDPLPAERQESGGSEATDSAPPAGDGDIEIIFDVSAGGRSTNIRVGALSPGVEKATAVNLKWYIGALRFRPRIENGKPVMTHDVKLKYSVDARGRITHRVE